MTYDELTERFYAVRGQRDRLLRCCEIALHAYDKAHEAGRSNWTGEEVDKMRAIVKEVRDYRPADLAVIYCEHGIKDGDWCEPCNNAMKASQREQLEGYECSAGFCGGMSNRLSIPAEVSAPIRKTIAEIMEKGTTQPLTCACCGEASTNPGQFVRDGRWVCTEDCRRNLINVDSYDDLAASGGIVDAP